MIYSHSFALCVSLPIWSIVPDNANLFLSFLDEIPSLRGVLCFLLNKLVFRAIITAVN